MKNKILEKILIQNNHKSLVDFIENCEQGRILEIRVQKDMGITSDLNIDKKLYSYLKRLKIKVIFISENVELSQKKKNKFYQEVPKCSGTAHEIVTSSELTAIEKADMLEEGKHIRFRIDEQSYVHCGDCNGMLKLSL